MTRQPYSTYLFILVKETVFIFIKESENVQCQLFFNNQFLYITYANDTTLFLSDKNPETEVIQIIEHFSISEKKRWEIAGTGVLKEVQIALCGMECVNLKTNTIRILGIHFSYNRSLENDKNYGRYIIKI